MSSTKIEKHVISRVKKTPGVFFVSAKDIFPAMYLLFCHTTNDIASNISILVKLQSLTTLDASKNNWQTPGLDDTRYVLTIRKI